jgi:hypothetical protein
MMRMVNVRQGGLLVRVTAKGKTNPSDMISASEIACFAYCPEQWRLEHGLNLLPANTVALHAGTRHHKQKAVIERAAGRSIGIGWAMVIAAVILLVMLWLIWR